jgi:hypothetical protein
MKRLVCVLSALCATAVLTGCGGNCTVRGRVVYPDGSPVPNLGGRGILFEAAESHYCAVGTLDTDSRFELYSIQPGDGVRPGIYRVRIPALPDPVAPDVNLLTDRKMQKPLAAPPDPIHPKYREVESSGLDVVVDRNLTDLKLTVEPPDPPRGKK